jgi:hypothetical protein
MFCLSAVLMLVASVALAQETKITNPETASSSPEIKSSSSATAADSPPPAHVLQQGQEELIAEDESLFYEPLQVGDATQSLLAWQRGGEISSTTPRPIAGAVANRSYERYLKSFEFPIPERMTSSVKATSGWSGNSGK